MMYTWREVLYPFGTPCVSAKRSYEAYLLMNWYLFERDGKYAVLRHKECTAGSVRSSGTMDDRRSLETDKDLMEYRSVLDAKLTWVPRERVTDLLDAIRQKEWLVPGSHLFVEDVENWLARPLAHNGSASGNRRWYSWLFD